MAIRRLEVRRFRGVRELDWDVGGNFICLVGPGDATKSTVLEAINLGLSARRQVTFEDTDFYDCNSAAGLEIRVTVGDVPKALLSLGKFGDLVRGWGTGQELHDEPRGDDEPVLTVCLAADESLEPAWAVVNDRDPDGKRIGATDRALLRVARIGAFIDWQLSWGPGTALARLTDDAGRLELALVEARRRLRDSLKPEDVADLAVSARRATEAAQSIGVKPQRDSAFGPRFDVRGLTLGAGLVSLHDGVVPVRQAGLGSARLLATALQQESEGASITLVDEVEHGLEPHRLRRLLRVLRAEATPPSGAGAAGTDRPARQVFVTTHSPVTLTELEPADIRLVRVDSGSVAISKPASDLRRLLRSSPEAFLSRTVVVCEGKTELGLCRAFDGWWAGTGGENFGVAGVSLSDGGGNTQGPAAALHMRALGYRVIFFGDSDQPPQPGPDEMAAGGVTVVLWPGGACTEVRVATDLPWSAFVGMVELAMEFHGRESVRDRVTHQLQLPPGSLPPAPPEWRDHVSEPSVRKAFGESAHDKGWFKRVNWAEALGGLVVSVWPELGQSALAQGVEALRTAVHG